MGELTHTPITENDAGGACQIQFSFLLDEGNERVSDMISSTTMREAQ